MHPAGADSVGNAPKPVAPVRTVPVVNAANGVTLLRILLVPVFGWMLLQPGFGWRFGALAVFLFASLTDHVDGELARRRDLITDLGKIADPIADKALMGMALVGLSIVGELWWWVTALILVREIGVTLLRFWVIRRGVIAASKGGKIKTVLQIAAIALFILPLGWTALFVGRDVVMAAAVLVTVGTGIDYLVRALRMRRA
ncbi:MAG: CDP-alcohol phosphatidyltransferase family protein [Streptosporangiales bacterium]|nr:CDP-alcohol phosphatidyltransferase family protein [Streptosporangiales bacterium]MBO0891108.1 CDP-alcohol phosphatidyltransferase family protein [Acidothermales bacterium]